MLIDIINYIENLSNEAKALLESKNKEKKLTRIICDWNKKEISAIEAMDKIEHLYEHEFLETWNDPLEKLII
jgi:hypothetical protein